MATQYSSTTAPGLEAFGGLEGLHAEVFVSLTELYGVYQSHVLCKAMKSYLFDTTTSSDDMGTAMTTMWKTLKSWFPFKADGVSSKDGEMRDVLELLVPVLKTAVAQSNEVSRMVRDLYDLNPDHELCILLSPFIPDKDLSFESLSALMDTMQEGLKERFLWDQTQMRSIDEQNYILEQLLAHLEDALREARGEVLMVVGKTG
jgi:hypothetical protein